MSHKSEKLNKFNIFKAKVENATKHKIQSIWCDNKGEYIFEGIYQFL